MRTHARKQAKNKNDARQALVVAAISLASSRRLRRSRNEGQTEKNNPGFD
jgi:hypothetical protein